MISINKITVTNKILYLANLIIALGMISYLLWPKKEEFNERRSDNKFSSINVLTPLPYSDYEELIGSRDLFVPLVKEEKIEKETLLSTELPQVRDKQDTLPLYLPPPSSPAPPSPPPPPSPSAPPSPPPPPKVPLEKQISTLSLIGVIFDERGGTAIIQDKRQNKQYFLKKGDMIQGVKVEDVLEDKVILKDGDEEVELRM